MSHHTPPVLAHHDPSSVATIVQKRSSWRNSPLMYVGVPGTGKRNISSSPAMLLMPRTSVSTLSPSLYSLGPSCVEGTSGVNDILVNGILTSSKLFLICAMLAGP